MIRVTIVVLFNIGLAWTTLTAADAPVRVLVWNEQQPEQKPAYGDKFLGKTIAAYLGSKNNIQVKSVALSAPEQGLDEATLNQTDVIVMWAHKRSKEVKDENAERVMNRMIAGRLGLIAIHSAHWTKPFVRLMQERAKADAIAKVPEAERVNAKWSYLNKGHPLFFFRDNCVLPFSGPKEKNCRHATFSRISSFNSNVNLKDGHLPCCLRDLLSAQASSPSHPAELVTYSQGR